VLAIFEFLIPSKRPREFVCQLIMNKKFQNRLAHEKSPYLLQHADNPVDWYPWADEAFKKAKLEDKPVFLSIGYSTCHWCHVMAHESFENPKIGALMNDAFISIKVDREERPDIDMVYMKVCQMMTGSGGWPLTIIMTPDKKPFFAGTYIPGETRFGRIGMPDLILRIKEVWTTRREEVLNSANQITSTLKEMAAPAPGQELGEGILHQAYNQLKDRFDEDYGGFGVSPKFPTPHNLLFLLRYWKRTNDENALDMVEKTLRMMRRGGIYDQVGFGFHRYSTDQRWLVPHFEKMLYDQALLALAYLETFQITRKEEYARIAREIFEYVLRDLTDTGGGFYSAEDADSEGEEGKFYLWDFTEILEVLTPEKADILVNAFNIKKNGNFTDETTGGKSGRNILHLTKPLEKIAPELGIDESELRTRLESIRQELLVHREKRTRPHKDDKILTDWNGLMIAALAKGGRILDESEYTHAAIRAVDFIFGNLIGQDGCLLHRYRDGDAGLTGNLDDYAFLINGLLELYETTYQIEFLNRALKLNHYLVEHFWDDTNGGFYFTGDNETDLLVRQKEIYDGAVPSGNSVAMLNLIRLGRITADSDLEQKAALTGKCFYENVATMPSGYTQLLIAVDFAVGPSYEVVITGDSRTSDTREMLKAVQQEFLPNKVVIFNPAETSLSGIKDIAPYVKNHFTVDGKATAYVCSNYKCKLPTTDVSTMMSLFDI